MYSGQFGILYIEPKSDPGNYDRLTLDLLWSNHGPIAANFVFPKYPEATFRFPFVAIRTAKFQKVAASIGSVTADAANKDNVVPPPRFQPTIPAHDCSVYHDFSAICAAT